MAKPSGFTGGQVAKALIERAIEPARSVPERARPAARLLSLLILCLAFFLAIILPFLLSIPAFRAGSYSEEYVILLLLLAIVYGISRSRHTAPAAFLAVAVTSAAIWIFALTDPSLPDRAALTLSFLVIPTVLCGLLLPVPTTLGWAGLNLAAFFFLGRLIPGLSNSPIWITLLLYAAVYGMLAVIVAACRQSDQAVLQSREQIFTESQAQLHALLDNLPDAIYFKDRQSRFLRVSKALVAKHGFQDSAQIIGTSDFDFFSADHAQATFDTEQEIIRSGKPINLESPEIWPDRPPTWASVTKMPFRDGSGNIIGTFGISRDITERKLAEQALQEASRRQAEWIGELERRNREIALLNQMSDLIQTCPDIREACAIISELSRQLFPAEAGGLYMINASRNLVEQVSSWGGELGDVEVFTPDDCWGLRLGRLHAMDRRDAGGARSEDTLAIRCNHLRAPGPEAYICVPLVAQGEAIGLLHVRKLAESGAGQGGEWFTEERQQLTRSAAHRMALALANLILREKLRQQSIRDALTGLYNRRYLEESLDRELHRASRSKRAVGIIMIDVDHFKTFNDANGHDAGDAVLRELGAVLRPKIRAEDIACRYGGEEFALVMPDASLEITSQRAEMLCEDVRKLNVVFNGHSLGAVTISAGVACYPDHGATVEAVISAADAALYGAKRAGRDQVVVAGSSASSQTG